MQASFLYSSFFTVLSAPILVFQLKNVKHVTFTWNI